MINIKLNFKKLNNNNILITLRKLNHNICNSIDIYEDISCKILKTIITKNKKLFWPWGFFVNYLHYKDSNLNEPHQISTSKENTTFEKNFIEDTVKKLFNNIKTKEIEGIYNSELEHTHEYLGIKNKDPKILPKNIILEKIEIFIGCRYEIDSNNV